MYRFVLLNLYIILHIGPYIPNIGCPRIPYLNVQVFLNNCIPFWKGTKTYESEVLCNERREAHAKRPDIALPYECTFFDAKAHLAQPHHRMQEIWTSWRQKLVGPPGPRRVKSWALILCTTVPSSFGEEDDLSFSTGRSGLQIGRVKTLDCYFEASQEWF